LGEEAPGIAPTVRDRCASKALLSSSEQDPTALPSPESESEGYAAAGPAVEWMKRKEEDGLMREESCSQLFLEGLDEETEELAQREFEDRYSMLGDGPLGEGTFGLVWRCAPKQTIVSTEIQERAAKIVRKSRLNEREMKLLLGPDGEVRTHITMKHVNIVELYEYFDEPNTVTLVLEYCRGGDLFDAIVNQKKTNWPRTSGASCSTRHAPGTRCT